MTTRRLAAILAADVVGYSRMMGADEAGTLARLQALRRGIIDPAMASTGGRLVKDTGDGVLAEFASAVEAVRCALDVQEQLRIRSASEAVDKRMELRIGINVGDVIATGDDLHGDGVNVAARLEALAEPGGIVVSAPVREYAAGRVDCRFEDIGEQELKNIARKVRAFRIRTGEAERPTQALPDKPSLAVLPFANLSGDAEQEYFADGVVEDIITALSRTGWLFVIARNSSFAYKGKSPDIRTVGRELGVRYVLEGSVRRAGTRVRITCQLIEAATGGHVWADRFDGELADIFDLQDRITQTVVGAIEPSLRRAEIARAIFKPTESLNAYDLYLRALPQYQAMTKAGLDAAVALLRRALEIDPAYPRAKALLATAYNMRADQGWGEPGDRQIAIVLGRETLATGTDDPDALCGAAFALFFAGDNAAAITVLKRALQIHPNSARVLHYLGVAHGRGNDPNAAIHCIERAIRLSPLDSEIGDMHVTLGINHLVLGHDAEALPWLQQATHELPNSAYVYRFLVQVLARLGRHDEARTVAAHLLAVHPEHRVGPADNTRFTPQFNEERRQALLAAGIPE